MTCRARRCATAGDWLEVQASVLAPLRLDEATGGPVDPGLARDLLDWVARHTVEVCSISGPVSDVLDTVLTAPCMVAYASRIVERSGLPHRLLEHTQAALDVIADHGCECRTCQPRDPDNVPPRTERCRFWGVPDAAHAVIGYWWPMRERVGLDAPVWAYQLTQQWSRAQGSRAAKEARSKRNAEAAINELKMRGLA